MAEVAPEFKPSNFRLLGFDGQGGLQLIGGLVIGLIALYSSYDHVNLFKLHPPQPSMGRLAHRCLAGGCGCRSRRLLRSNCSIGVAIQAEARERQGQGIALLRSAALLSARVQLDPSELNRSRLTAFLALLTEQAF